MAHLLSGQKIAFRQRVEIETEILRLNTSKNKEAKFRTTTTKKLFDVQSIWRRVERKVVRLQVSHSPKLARLQPSSFLQAMTIDS